MFTIEPCVGKHYFENFPPFELVKITPKEPTRIGNIEIHPRSYTLPKDWIKTLELLHKFNVREDDVWITTFPKCGTTWMQEMCWLIVNNYDFEAANQTDLEFRSPYFEYNTMVPTHLFNSMELLEKLQTPRVIKTHQPVGLLPAELWTKNPKIIHVARDPRDAVVSQYHMIVGQGMSMGTLEEFLRSSLDDSNTFSIGTFWSHTLDLWKLRHNPNYLFVAFEEMKRDLASVIKKVCTFLNKPITEEQMIKMVEHLSFDSMKNNESLNHNLETNIVATLMNKKAGNFRFMRKGEVGSHKNEFPAEFCKIFDEWVHENLKDSDFPLYLNNLNI